MTVTDLRYLDEVIGGLRRRGIEVRHFALIASPDRLHDRLRERGAGGAWARQQIDRCVRALPGAPFAEQVDTDDREAREVVAAIGSALGG